MPCPFIPDGYTREALIPAGVSHPEICMTYRPMLAAERRRLAQQTVRLGGHGGAGREAAAGLVAAALTGRVVSWDLFDDRGRMVEITPAAILALDPELFEKIHATIAAFEDEEIAAKN